MYLRFGITIPNKYINLTSDPYCPVYPFLCFSRTFQMIVVRFFFFIYIRMEIKGTRICFYIPFSFLEHYFSTCRGSLDSCEYSGTKCLFRFRVKLKAEVFWWSNGEKHGGRFVCLQGNGVAFETSPIRLASV